MSIESIKAKSDRLTELQLELLACMEAALKIAMKDASKYPAVTLKRTFRIMGYCMKAKMINNQMKVVKAAPINPGNGLAIVGGIQNENNN